MFLFGSSPVDFSSRTTLENAQQNIASEVEKGIKEIGPLQHSDPIEVGEKAGMKLQKLVKQTSESLQVQSMLLVTLKTTTKKKICYSAMGYSSQSTGLPVGEMIRKINEERAQLADKGDSDTKTASASPILIGGTTSWFVAVENKDHVVVKLRIDIKVHDRDKPDAPKLQLSTAPGSTDIPFSITSMLVDKDNSAAAPDWDKAVKISQFRESIEKNAIGKHIPMDKYVPKPPEKPTPSLKGKPSNGKPSGHAKEIVVSPPRQNTDETSKWLTVAQKTTGKEAALQATNYVEERVAASREIYEEVTEETVTPDGTKTKRTVRRGVVEKNMGPQSTSVTTEDSSPNDEVD